MNDCPQIEVLEEITQKLTDTSPNFGLCDITRRFNRHEKKKKKVPCLWYIELIWTLKSSGNYKKRH